MCAQLSSRTTTLPFLRPNNVGQTVQSHNRVMTELDPGDEPQNRCYPRRGRRVCEHCPQIRCTERHGGDYRDHQQHHHKDLGSRHLRLADEQFPLDHSEIDDGIAQKQAERQDEDVPGDEKPCGEVTALTAFNNEVPATGNGAVDRGQRLPR